MKIPKAEAIAIKAKATFPKNDIFSDSQIESYHRVFRETAKSVAVPSYKPSLMGKIAHGIIDFFTK